MKTSIHTHAPTSAELLNAAARWQQFADSRQQFAETYALLGGNPREAMTEAEQGRLAAQSLRMQEKTGIPHDCSNPPKPRK